MVLNDTAITWIRDGVLVNRMHINPVAFAVAYWLFIDETARRQITLELLVDFAFAQSGISCAEKITLFKQGHESIQPFNIQSASAFYNELATAMALSCTFFPGALDLLKNLQLQGAHNFITSAVEQEILDDWSKSVQGRELSPYLTEVLGKRKNFGIGRDHFAYVSERINGGTLYAVADAPSEIKTASQLRQEFKITPIGFAYVVKQSDLVEAMNLAAAQMSDGQSTWLNPPPYMVAPQTLRLRSAMLHLPDEGAISPSLKAAGAEHVAEGDAKTIMGSLSSILLS